MDSSISALLSHTMEAIILRIINDIHAPYCLTTVLIARIERKVQPWLPTTSHLRYVPVCV
jgi:hypothetical protein